MPILGLYCLLVTFATNKVNSKSSTVKDIFYIKIHEEFYNDVITFLPQIVPATVTFENVTRL